jgi:hypothetical protein
MAKSKQSQQDLIEAIHHAEDQAESPTLNEQREEALAYYNGDPFGNEVDGKSQVVSRDVHDTIEWIKPSLLKIFASGDEVVKFNPVGAEDVPAAEQESEYINHILMQKNDGFMILHNWFHDALLLKNAYVKVEWETKTQEETEKYGGLTEEELALVMQDESVEIVGGDVDEYGYYTIQVKMKEEYGCVKITNLPPENCLVSHSLSTVDVTDADFFQHRDWVTISSLRESGYDVDDDIADDENEELMSHLRDEDADSYNHGDTGISNDPAMRRVQCCWTWIRHDMNGDGTSELNYVISVGDTILFTEVVDTIPVAALCPCPQPHRHNGDSVADSVMDLQLIKSQLMRGYFDNMYLTNNGRYAVSDRVNLSDMLNSRAGGVVRVNGEPSGAIMPLVHPQQGGAILQGIEYIDGVRENRTGVTRYNQGIDANSLNKTATGISQIMSASQQRIELIARLFAEGVKTLAWLTHKVTKQNATKPDVIQLRNKFVPVDPREWKTRNDLSVSVGLGNGNKDQQLMHLQNIIMAQKEGLQIGLATPKNIYNALTKLTQNAGFKDTESFWTDPEAQQQQQPKPDPEMLKMQAEQQKDQAKMQMDQQFNQAKLQLDQEKMQGQMSLEQWKAEQDVLLEKYKAELKANSDAEIQQAKLALQEQAEQTKLTLQANKDAAELMARIQGEEQDRQNRMFEKLAEISERMSQPRTATLSSGKKVTIN